MPNSLLQQGLLLMVTGMGTVYVFLTLLVVAMNIMSRLLARLPADVPPPSTGNSNEEVAAIAAAINMHRSRQKSR